jgi:type VI secretion system ImpB/VipA family protein
MRDARESLPRILVVGDFAQRAGEGGLAGRAPHRVDVVLPAWLRSHRISLDCDVPNVLHDGWPPSFAIQLAPRDIAALTPDSIVAALPLFAGYLELRHALKGLRACIGCELPFNRRIKAAFAEPELRAQLALDLEGCRTGAPEPHPLVAELIALTDAEPGEVSYRFALLGIRHMASEHLRTGAKLIDVPIVEAEAERVAAALAAQVAVLLKQPVFMAIERVWRGLDMLVQQGPHARIDAVACTEDELEGDLRTGDPALLGWIREAERERAPYTAVLFAFDLERPGQGTVLNRLAWFAQHARIPFLVGASSGLGMLFGAPLLVPLTSSVPVRPPYGHGDGAVSVRAFPFEEPPGGPPRARWASGAHVLASCLAPGGPERRSASTSFLDDPVGHLAHALAQSRRSNS